MKYPEERLQASCVKWFDLQYPDLSQLLIHPANGGFRTPAEAGIFKAMGTRPGVADLLLLIPSKDFSLLAIEMKAAKGRQSPRQKEWQLVAEQHNIKYVVVRELYDFIDIVENYLK